MGLLACCAGVCSAGFCALCLLPVEVRTLNGRGKCWPLLSIKDSIDLRQESVSAASHPWTADNGPQHRGHGWKQSSSTGSEILPCKKMCDLHPHYRQPTAEAWLVNLFSFRFTWAAMLLNGHSCWMSCSWMGCSESWSRLVAAVIQCYFIV